MDVSDILAAQATKQKSVTVEREVPLDVDAGYLMVTDHNAIDQLSYGSNLEEHLLSNARDGIQVLIASLFSLPTESSTDGPLAVLPPPTTMLPRTKHLPKPKPPTKWEKFAAAKGIQKKRQEKKVWDEEKQEWVNRWGKDGKNKQIEQQWITEVPANAEVDFDPAKVSRDARKARVAKNQLQQVQNIARAEGGSKRNSERQRENERTIATNRISTASMGKFDQVLEGEKKPRGIKRKFDPTEAPARSEKKAALALISKLDTVKAAGGSNGRDPVNSRKAVRFANSQEKAPRDSAQRGKKRAKR